MIGSDSVHVRFLARARRRWIAWRIVECAGVCAAIGAAVGFAVIPVLVWRDQPALLTAASLLTLGAAAGAIWAMTRRPNLLQTAMLIDRQLGLQDLLSTALNPATIIDGAFGPVVRSQADATCGRISPNELILRRLGSRAWGGIGIASALLLTLAMMSSEPRITTAQVDGAFPFAQPAERASDQSALASPAQPPISRSASENKNTRSREDADEASARDRTFETNNPSAAVARVDAAGSSAARTNDASIPRLDSTGQNRVDAVSNPSGVPGSASAGASVGVDGQSTSPADSVSSNKSTPIAPWQSNTWPADRAAALENLRSGQVPDAYRDMVREYFDPAPDSR